ncbi:MAG: NAD-dependent epimerase/dehydratase family protein [Candidatus Micrarchaeia archaeon]
MPNGNKNNRKGSRAADPPGEGERRLKVLITGSTSKLGVNLSKAMVKKGYEVRVFIPAGPELSGEWSKLPYGVIPFVGDFTLKHENDKEALVDACRDVDVLFHIGGANYNYQNSYKQLIETNVVGTENVISSYLEANKKEKNLHFVFTSTTSVYGYKRPGEVLTEESETAPARGYPESKLMAEKVIDVYGTTNSNLHYTILRLSKLYGIGYEGPFFKMFKLLDEGKANYVGSGNNHITLLHVDDAVQALILAGNAPGKNAIYNVADGTPYTLKSLLILAAKMLGVEPPKRSINPLIAKILSSRVQDIKYDEFEFLTSDRIISIEKIKSELGFVPSVRLEEGAQELINAYKQKAKVYMHEKGKS